MSNSCRGCKFLYGSGVGYSNYTWMNTWVRCALRGNRALEDDQEEPFNWKDPDEWPPTMNGRCERYSPGVYITLDPDREDHPRDSSDDAEQIAAILAADNWVE